MNKSIERAARAIFTIDQADKLFLNDFVLDNITGDKYQFAAVFSKQEHISGDIYCNETITIEYKDNTENEQYKIWYKVKYTDDSCHKPKAHCIGQGTITRNNRT